MKDIKKVNSTQAIASSVLTSVKNVSLWNDTFGEYETHHLCQYEDVVLTFDNSDECDTFVSKYNEKLGELASLLSRENFLRDINSYCKEFGVEKAPKFELFKN